MATTLTFNGRLPGVLCQSALPPAGAGPLRLDVAGLVGFAERGPVDTPVAVEDWSQYRAVFGQDLLLARYRGAPVYAQLPQAVRSFFDNGGRRCYVVRVVGERAWSNRFRLPGLVAWNSPSEFDAVVAEASWVGRWSDNVGVATRLRSSPLRVKKYCPAGAGGRPELDLETPTATTVQPGDLLRLRFDTLEAPVAFFPVIDVRQTGESAATMRGVPVTAQAAPGTVIAFATALAEPLPVPISAERLEESGWTPVPLLEAALEVVPKSKGGGYALILPANSTVQRHDLVRVTCSGGPIALFAVQEVTQEREEMSPPSPARLRLTTAELLWASPQPTLGSDPSEADLLSFDLFIRESGGSLAGMETWTDLRFGARRSGNLTGSRRAVQPGGNARYWADVLTQNTLDPSAGIAAAQVEWVGNGLEQLPDYAAQNRTRAPLGRSLRLRAPAASLEDAPIYLPIGMGALPSPDEFTGPLTESSTGSPPEALPGKDGLDEFDAPDLFLDSNLRDTGSRDLLNEAEQLAFLGTPPQRLRKLHSLIPVEEVALIAAPDAIQHKWRFLGPEILGSPPLAPAPPAPDWSRFQNCPLARTVVSHFYDAFLADDDATARSYLTIELRDTLTTSLGRLMLGLDCASPSVFDLPDSSAVEFVEYLGNAAVVKAVMHFNARSDVTHVFTLVPRNESWAISCIERVPADQPSSAEGAAELAALPELDPPEAYALEPLLQVHTALVGLCAARADAVAILSLPRYFGAREVLEWQRQLTATPALLGGAELSYAAVYHPWLSAREEVTPQLAPLRDAPPDGTACGLIAARELARGPWIAPANISLRGSVGLTPKLTDADHIDLFNARVNVIRQQPGVFVPLSAHTLSLDPQLVQLSVRRLMIYLRKLALARGMRYAFESNNTRFRQLVQGAFERTLNALLALGAVNAFQVVTDDTVNTPNDVDNGRFIIALQVAPTLPVEFMTIVLLRSGESLLQALEI